ncbi:unnamed protein product (macronuclear) [Paramecium tetraurelia]|uniref:Uncharacterized protein n=1 Tax=Paramecium tetraurelia TaxID=5888 RepID=A0BWL7_PARTE|nr:uncharacterized protein GSPATT00032786001 [Paramecium tetraurelia]CAK62934.1 unnamed protein product [Paramecium tetraurelia]|eukprot:XP_001430332.1 hypothetical protein (macronuclear) [Paramecium tetraurelia strain d4-2]
MGSMTNFKNLVNSTQISKHLKSAHLLDARQDSGRYVSNHGDSPQTQTMSYEEMPCDLRHFIENHYLDNVVLLGKAELYFHFWRIFPMTDTLVTQQQMLGQEKERGKIMLRNYKKLILKTTDSRTFRIIFMKF